MYNTEGKRSGEQTYAKSIHLNYILFCSEKKYVTKETALFIKKNTDPNNFYDHNSILSLDIFVVSTLFSLISLFSLWRTFMQKAPLLL